MDEQMQELGKLYERAWAEGVWFREWQVGPGRFLAAAGHVRELEAAEAQLRGAGRLGEGDELSPLDLSDAEVVLAFTTYVRAGESRIEACRRAWAKLRRARRRGA